MFWIELIIVLAIIFIGVRVGGTFLAMAGGIGMFIMTFILHVTPSDPPITVILIMIAVICAAATMQACGGLDYLVRIAEKILRKNPKMITVLAPVVAYIFTFMCGTGHIVYSLLPVINEIAIETGVRPERPISASIVSSQQAITACPISAATVGILAFMAEATNYTKVNIFTLLIVCVPATLIGTVIAAIAVIKKGNQRFCNECKRNDRRICRIYIRRSNLYSRKCDSGSRRAIINLAEYSSGRGTGRFDYDSFEK